MQVDFSDYGKKSIRTDLKRLISCRLTSVSKEKRSKRKPTAGAPGPFNSCNSTSVGMEIEAKGLT